MFRASDRETERLVAVKLFTLDLAPERVHQLVAELERLTSANLTHPAIAAPLATGIRDNHAYLVMEYVAADSLDVAVRQYGAAPPAEALRVAAQLAGALDFAAVVNVAHGALHPRDLLLSPEETRLTGLGIARAFETLNLAAPVRRPYTPPEGIAGADWDRRADVFSLAALMHELLWGRRVQAIGAQAGGSLTALPGADLDALRALFSRALAERPEDRFATALDFAQALMQAFPAVASAAPGARAESAPAARAAEPPVEPRLPLDVQPVSAVDPPVKKIGRARVKPPATKVEPAARGQEQTPRVDVPPPIEPPAAAPVPADLDLRAAEADRYEAIDAPPAPDLPPLSVDDEHLIEPPGGIVDDHADPPISALERSRSALWPLALALLVGIAIGFASGYGAGNRDRSTPPARVDAPMAAARGEPSEPAGSGEPPAAAARADNSAPTARADAPAPPSASLAAPATDGSRGAKGAVADDPADAKNPGPKAGQPVPAAPAPGERAAHARTESASASKADTRSLKSDVSNLKSETSSSSGRVLVRSTPAGARVFVDGREEGLTPVAVRDLGRGDHRVRVVREGYGTEERRITITASHPAQSLTVPLAAAAMAEPNTAVPVPATPGTTGRFVGALSVDSRPSGAKVFVDGKLAGTTPLQLAGLDAGEHVVRIERDGYRRWSSSVRVVAYEHNRVTASLEK